MIPSFFPCFILLLLQVVHHSSAAERSVDNINELARASKTIAVPEESSTHAACVESSAFSRDSELANSVNELDELAGVSSTSAEPKKCFTHEPNPVWSGIASVKPEETLPSPKDHARSSRGGKRVRFATPTEIQLEDEGLIDDVQPATTLFRDNQASNSRASCSSLPDYYHQASVHSENEIEEVEEEDLTKNDEALARALDSAVNGGDDQDERGMNFKDDEALALKLAKEAHGDDWLTWQTAIQRRHSRPSMAERARRILIGSSSEFPLIQVLVYSFLFSKMLAFLIKSSRFE
ncbi:hypothetical protein PGT21_011619 [Puccinia graminis f. sp. tritici]|uniref:Uncharacterized protein n=1 Tax=Puccinia graminis f. sp. tritici TaxID=56615 RepID=A0A5B0PEX8_PUCGR|nr:hypothetical protein PGTUg99_014781 [Puccinia graminis f. sp. tritici]KAA1099556.1 hypothetical protein PGT21_011619 [Puccinia graminis f. sp. tritici]